MAISGNTKKYNKTNYKKSAIRFAIPDSIRPEMVRSISTTSTSSSANTLVEEEPVTKSQQPKRGSPHGSSHKSSSSSLPCASLIARSRSCKETIESLKRSIKAQEWKEVNRLLRAQQHNRNNAHSSALETKSSIKSNQDRKDRVVCSRDENGRNIFEFAIANKTPVDILESIIRIGGVEMLFEKDCTFVNNSPLHTACDMSCDMSDYASDIIQWIFKTVQTKNQDQSMRQGGQLQPQCLGEKEKHAQCKQLLLVKNKFGCTPLHIACSRGLSSEIIKQMITFGGKGLILETNNLGQNALHLACSCSDTSLEVIDLLIRFGCDGSNGGIGYIIRMECNDGRNALHISYMNRAPLDVIKKLLEMTGKEILFEKNKDEKNHLQLACINSVSDEVIQYFIQTGGKKLLLQNYNEHEHPLLLACEYGTSIQVIESFFTIMSGGMANELIMQRNEDRENALHILCKYGSSSTEVIKYIARRGGEEMIKECNKDGQNALHLTCMNGGDIEVMKILLDIAGDTIALDKDYNDGYNSLHTLSRNNSSMEAVKLLLDAGGDEILVATDDSGNTPLHIACDCSKTNLINIFVEKSNLEVISSVNNQDRTPLDLLLRSERP